MVGIISVVIGGHFGGGDHFDGGDHFGGGTALPHIIIAQIYLYSSDLSPQALRNLRIAFHVSDLLLFLKMCLDSFVYMWRLSSYRRAIKMLFFCRGEK